MAPPGADEEVKGAPDAGAAADSIAVLPPALADQIAAGEVVERPASIVKELVDNALDAGATRVDVELIAGGAERIRVVDDGRGIPPDQLGLALRRHATSKLRDAGDLIEIGTHGFRGEALASIAAVARVRLRSRRPEDDAGREIESIPGDRHRERPVAMTVGTHVDVEHLFASVPARRKFLRSEATEVGHCVEAVLRASLVHPGVAFGVRHGERDLLRLRAGTEAQRVEQVLDRRGTGPYHRAEGEHDGVRVVAYLADPRRGSRRGAAPILVVRRRVVRERTLATIVREAYGDSLARGVGALACVFIDPPHGSVDVNVHPQKVEVRFAEPQRVYAAVRRVLAESFESVPWARPGEADETRARIAEAGDAMARWEAARPPAVATGSATAPKPYALGTRAASAGYAAHKAETRRAAERVSAAADDRRVDRPRVAEPAPDPAPQLLASFPGHVAVFRFHDELWAVDLLALRAALLHARLAAELGGDGVVAQGLLAPVAVTVAADDAALVERSAESLRRIGVVFERFGEDAIVVRAVPALLPHCVDEASVHELVQRVLPWLRLCERSATTADDDAARVLAELPGRDPSPRLARRWLADARARFGDDIPGVRRWRPRQLVDTEPNG